jgi:hypothetical protein
MVHQVRRPLNVHISNACYVSRIEHLFELHRIGQDTLVFKMIPNGIFHAAFVPRDRRLACHALSHVSDMYHEPESHGQVDCIVKESVVALLGRMNFQRGVYFNFVPLFSCLQLLHDIKYV